MPSPADVRLGDLTVRRVGFGAMRLPGRSAFDNTSIGSRAAATAVLRRAMELGVNHVDTAAFYFSATRSANELINTALAPYPDDLVIVTKVGPARDPAGEWLPWARPEQLRGQVEENIRQLGRDHMDVVNLRTYGPGSIADHVGALADLRDAGLIRHIGLSNVLLDQIDEARDITPVVCVQNRFGLGAARSGTDEVLAGCRERGIAFVPFFAIAGEGREKGARAAPAGPADALVARIAAAHDATPAQIRLAWTLAQGENVLAIPGTADLAHLAENVAAGEIALTREEVAELDAVHRGAEG